MKSLLSYINMIFLVCMIFIMSACGSKIDVKDRMVGVKMYNTRKKPAELIAEWKDLGINTAFVPREYYVNSGDFRKLARENNIDSYIITPIFYNSEAIRADKELAAWTDKGKKAMDSWVHFVCPTKKRYIEKRLNYIIQTIKDLNPEGISLDFIRYFVFWEKVYADRTLASIDNSCFDDSCVEAFRDFTGITVPEDKVEITDRAEWILSKYEHEWTKFKCHVISETVRLFVSEAKKVNPDIKFAVHGVPWRQDDFDGAIKKITGQDYVALSDIVDYISPMCYSVMLKQDDRWISSVTADIKKQAGDRAKVVPCIQVNGFVYLEDEHTAGEFKKAVIAALQEPSDGIVFWNWKMFGAFPEKKKVLKKLLR